MLDPSSPTAVVTGASSGLGAGFATQLAAKGNDLVLIARRRSKLNDLAGQLKDDWGVGVEVLPADLGTETGIHSVEIHLKQMKQVDLLINAAGFGMSGPFVEQPLERIREIISVHDAASVRLTFAVLPGMLARRSGAIINVSSLSAFAPMPGNVMYSATKAFLVNFSRALNMETARSGVYIQALCPGFFHSEFHDVMRVNKKVIPGPLFMTADQVARRSLKALRRKSVLYVPGFLYRLAAFVTRLPGLGPGLISLFVSVFKKRRGVFTPPS